ncbi:hypothetical protein [Streptomyces meridianus]|uniref:Immunity protein 35 domain-containing protein n=1 Tax=Streptomyces meridianus TaxID=2938945 RepID=A0ABT0XBF5_9ACTN|nr:hypothetical protein [Streptomyces meridianus]MCM2579853.1 hypothetical protein [Streptomyces meridianus]
MNPSPEPAASAPRPPANADEALAMARAEFQPLLPDGTPAPLHVQEFDLGYLVYAVFPRHEDTTAPPTLGGSHVVVSKTTGKLGYVPNFPPETAIETYRRHYAPDA